MVKKKAMLFRSLLTSIPDFGGEFPTGRHESLRNTATKEPSPKKQSYTETLIHAVKALRHENEFIKQCFYYGFPVTCRC
jgi:hypothetical protein